MKNFAAHASDDEPQSPIIPAFSFKKNYPMCAQYRGTPPKGADVKLNCKANVEGRYVYIHTYKKSALTLCEVQIFGKPVADKRPGNVVHIMISDFSYIHQTMWKNWALNSVVL